MKDIRFLQDYRGVLTGEKYYLSGTVASLPDLAAGALVAAGRADYLPVEIDEREEIASEPAPATVEEKPKRQTRRKAKA